MEEELLQRAAQETVFEVEKALPLRGEASRGKPGGRRREEAAPRRGAGMLMGRERAMLSRGVYLFARHSQGSETACTQLYWEFPMTALTQAQHNVHRPRSRRLPFTPIAPRR